MVLPLTLALLAATPGPSRDLAVFDLSLGTGVDKGLGPFLSQVLANEVTALTGEQPLLSSDLGMMLGFERQKQLAGCTDTSCMAELSAALGVARAISGSVTLVDDRYLVTLTLLDVKHAQPLARFADASDKKADALTKTVQRGVRVLFPKVPVQVSRPPDAPNRIETPTVMVRSGHPTRTAGYVVGGVAVALAGTGVALGAVALSQADSNDPSSARNTAHVADGLYAAAAVGAGVAAWLFFRRGDASVAFAPSPHGAAIIAGATW